MEFIRSGVTSTIAQSATSGAAAEAIHFDGPPRVANPEPSARSSFRAPDRISGLLLGTAIGDALGMPVEGMDNRLTLKAIHRLGGVRHFVAPQPHVLRSLRRLRPGCWTDETQLVLQTTRAMIAENAVHYDAIAANMVHAFENFELRGWDTTTKQGCRRLAQGTHRLRSGKLGADGNAIAARIAPIAAWSFMRGETRQQLLEHCFHYGVMTHHDVRAITGAYLIALLIRDALAAPRRWEPAPTRYQEIILEAKWAEHVLSQRLGHADDNLSRHLEELEDALDSDSVEIAEYCNGAESGACESVSYVIALLLGRSWDFEEGVIAAVNGGGDTDTNAAMVGAVLGAAHGARKLPRAFVDRLEEVEIIRELGETYAAML